MVTFAMVQQALTGYESEAQPVNHPDMKDSSISTNHISSNHQSYTSLFIYVD